MNWIFNLVDKFGTPSYGDYYIDGVASGSYTGTQVITLTDIQTEITFVPDPDLNQNNYTAIIPAGYGDSIIGAIPDITIIFQEIDDYEPICNFAVLRLQCSTDVFVLYTVATSMTPRLTWNFGDGTIENYYGQLYALHKYGSFNTFTISLQIEICHADVLVDEDGCPCRNTNIYTENPVAEVASVVGDVTTYSIPIDNFYRGNCCQDAKLLLTIYANGADVGTTYGGLTLISTAIDESDTVINFSNNASIISGPIATQFVIKGASTNEACNNFAIPMIFDFSNFI